MSHCTIYRTLKWMLSASTTALAAFYASFSLPWINWNFCAMWHMFKVSPKRPTMRTSLTSQHFEQFWFGGFVITAFKARLDGENQVIVQGKTIRVWLGESCICLVQDKHEILMKTSQQSFTEQLIEHLSAKGKTLLSFLFSCHSSPRFPFQYSSRDFYKVPRACGVCWIHQAE